MHANPINALKPERCTNKNAFIVQYRTASVRKRTVLPDYNFPCTSEICFKRTIDKV